MAFMDIIYSILGPSWLIGKINLIALILSGAFLVYFGSFVHGRIILPIGDWVRGTTHAKVSEIEKVSWMSNIIATSFATIFFLLYVYFGGFILAEYVFAPIMYRLRSVILIVVIGLFFLISYAINDLNLREKFMG